MLDLPLRILLVIALVLWSPAWCCCALRATIDGKAQVGEAATTICKGRWGGDGGSSPRAHDRAMDLAPCCIARVAERNADRDRDACCGDDSDCRCDQRPNELVRLNTAVAVTIPTLERITPMLIAVHELGHAADDGSTHFLDARDHPAHAPPRTLFAQRCLLLT